MGKELTKVFETEELNDLLIKLGVEPDTPTQLIAQIIAILSSTESIDSGSSSFTATAYTAGVFHPKVEEIAGPQTADISRTL